MERCRDCQVSGFLPHGDPHSKDSGIHGLSLIISPEGLSGSSPQSPLTDEIQAMNIWEFISGDFTENPPLEMLLHLFTGQLLSEDFIILGPSGHHSNITAITLVAGSG